MNKQQKLLFLIFVISYTIRTAITCFAIDIFIKLMGDEKLGSFYSYGAMMSLAMVVFLTFASKKFSSVIQFLFVHILFVLAACACFFLKNENIQAQTLFLCMNGLGIFVYFTNWSMSNVFVSIFESKRLYPLLNLASQVGVFLGTIFAISSNYGLPKAVYIPTWFAVEALLVALGVLLFLLHRTKKSTSASEQSSDDAEKVNLIQIFKQYQHVPRVTLWVLLWAFLYTAILTMTGGTFNNSGINLTALYGVLALGAALLSAVVSVFIYPKVVERFHVATMFFLSGILVLGVGSAYLASEWFWLAVLLNVLFEVLDSCFVAISVGTELSIYPTVYRDRIRLLAEIFAGGIGGSCVGLFFLLPKEIVPWLLGALFILLNIIGFKTKKSFNKEILSSLKDRSDEERQNAIAVFDNIEDKQGYQEMMRLLAEDPSLQVRVSVLNTFANLKTIRPAASVIRILESTEADPLKIAVLRYLDHVPLKGLDPFLQYQLQESLKVICRSRASNVLRSLSVKVLVQNGDPHSTVSFIMQALKDSDERVVANAIEGLDHVNYPGAADILLPYLNHTVSRVQANAVIALWKYPEIHAQVERGLEHMLGSSEPMRVVSGMYAVGEVKDLRQIELLEKRLADPAKDIHRNALVALLKLGQEKYCDEAAQIIVGDDESQGINLCWLVLRLDETMLNEKIIATIYSLGKEKRDIAIRRFSKCGGFCRDQIKLLSGERNLITRG